MGAIVVPYLFLFHIRITQLITTHNIRPIGRSQLDIFVFNTPIGNTSLFSFNYTQAGHSRCKTLFVKYNPYSRSGVHALKRKKASI